MLPFSQIKEKLFVLSKILCNKSTSCNGIGEYSRVSTCIALKKVLSNIPTKKKKDTENRAVCDCLGWTENKMLGGFYVLRLGWSHG